LEFALRSFAQVDPAVWWEVHTPSIHHANGTSGVNQANHGMNGINQHTIMKQAWPAPGPASLSHARPGGKRGSESQIPSESHDAPGIDAALIHGQSDAPVIHGGSDVPVIHAVGYHPRYVQYKLVSLPTQMLSLPARLPVEHSTADVNGYDRVVAGAAKDDHVVVNAANNDHVAHATKDIPLNAANFRGTLDSNDALLASSLEFYSVFSTREHNKTHITLGNPTHRNSESQD
jgi:hypothetical protein